MSKEKLLFIYNPHAGQERLKSKLADIFDAFSARGFEIIAAPTAGHKDATETAFEYAIDGKISRIVCAGGDGTLNEVVSGVLKSGKNVPIGYIPCGSTNDFGYSLKLPKTMAAAADFAASKKPVPCDVGNINGKAFLYTAAFGAFSDVSYDTPQNIKNTLGHMAYILSGMTKLTNIKAVQLNVEYEDPHGKDLNTDGEFILGMVANSDSVGGFKGITGKHVKLDDGIYEMILVRKPNNLIDITNLVNSLFAGEINGAGIVYSKVKNVNIKCGSELMWSLDGEFGGNMPDARIEVRKRAVSYICCLD